MKSKTVQKLLCVLLAAIVVGMLGRYYCSTLAPAASGPSSDGHEHQHGTDSAQVTVWSERFEIFLEHAPIVAKTPTEFVTHVTDLVTLEPRKAGPVTFMLQPASGPVIRHEEPAPARDGIYIPALSFPEAGDWTVSIIITLDGKDHVIELPPSRVYASVHDAAHGPAPEQPEGFGFLKEQQWQVPTKVERVQKRDMSGQDVLAVSESALIEQNAMPALYVQSGGETFEKRRVETGLRLDGFVQILLGLSEGEYVVTQGVGALAMGEMADDGGHQHTHAADAHEDQAGHVHDEAQPGQDMLTRYDVEIHTVGPGVLELQTKLAGEVKLNADRVAHVVPQVAGKVREVLKSEGSTVKTGEVMGWIESAALGQAKIDYLSKFAEISCCTIELTRASEVYENANRLLEALESSPSLESLSDTDWGPMGKVRSDLVSAYAELQYTKAAFEREKRLFEKKITSGDEFQKAQSNVKKAEALYQATRDRVAFEVQHDLLEATRAQQIRELDVAGAERNLYVLGLTIADVHALQTLTTPSGTDQGATVCADPNCPSCVKARADVAGQLAALESENSHSEGEHVCTDPNCTDCAEHEHTLHAERQLTDPVRSNERLAWYPMRAPFDGTVISKHLSLGESVKDDGEVFVIADLSTVWVDFRVHQRDLTNIMCGQTVVIDYGPHQIDGVITYIAPVVGDDTRTALARVVAPNPSGSLRPGTFVTGTVAIDRQKTAMVIERSAVQYVDDQACVFVYDGHAFDKRNVTLGRTDGKRIEVIEGLKPEEKVVTKNAFRIKAELEKSKTALSGHGHVH